MIFKITIATLDGPIFEVNTTRNITNKEIKLINYIDLYILLNKERNKIINKLKSYHSVGIIGSIFFTRNKYIQKELDELVRKKQIINKSIKQIHDLYM